MKRMMRARVNRTLAIAALFCAGSAWGAGFLLGKIAFKELPVSEVTLYRFAIAAVALMPFAIIRRISPNLRDLPLFIGTGCLMVPVTFQLQYTGLALTTATDAALIIGTLPPLLALASKWFCCEKITIRGWLAIAISTSGIVLLFGIPGADRSWAGDALVLASMFVVVLWVFLSTSLIRKYTAIVATAYLLLFGTLAQIPVCLLWDGHLKLHVSNNVLAAMLGLGLVCTALAYGLWNWGLTQVSMSQAGLYTNVEPLVGALLGIVFLHERLGPGALIGGFLILCGGVIIAIHTPPATSDTVIDIMRESAT